MTINRHLKWLWILTVANVALAALVIFLIYAVMNALAAFAAYVSTWPLFAMLFLGVTVSIIGIGLSSRTLSSMSRHIGYVVNGSVIAMYLLIIMGIGTLFLKTTEERFIVPATYMGNIFVVYNAANGEPAQKTFWGTTYYIPSDGILLNQEPMIRQFTRTHYYYQNKNGTLQRIRNLWPTTIERTPENLTNNRDKGVFFPRSGTFNDITGCQFEYDEFYVGTKAYLLSNNQEKDISSYLKNHLVGCSKRLE